MQNVYRLKKSFKLSNLPKWYAIDSFVIPEGAQITFNEGTDLMDFFEKIDEKSSSPLVHGIVLNKASILNAVKRAAEKSVRQISGIMTLENGESMKFATRDHINPLAFVQALQEEIDSIK